MIMRLSFTLYKQHVQKKKRAKLMTLFNENNLIYQ